MLAVADAPRDARDKLYMLQNCKPIAVPPELADGCRAVLALDACNRASVVKLNSRRAIVTRSGASTAAADSSISTAEHIEALYSNAWHAMERADPGLQVRLLCSFFPAARLLGCAGVVPPCWPAAAASAADSTRRFLLLRRHAHALPAAWACR